MRKTKIFLFSFGAILQKILNKGEIGVMPSLVIGEKYFINVFDGNHKFKCKLEVEYLGTEPHAMQKVEVFLDRVNFEIIKLYDGKHEDTSSDYVSSWAYWELVLDDGLKYTVLTNLRKTMHGTILKFEFLFHRRTLFN